ncbi:MAG: EboA family metabolite traffic protein [Cyanobacteria bacterium P01_F01_bin.86]
MVAIFPNAAVTFAGPSQIANYLHAWLIKRLGEASVSWLDQTVQQLAESASERVLFTRFSAASRQVGKADLALTEDELEVAQTLRAGWMPGQWSIDQATRSLLLLTFPSQDADRYVGALEKLFAAADVAEQVALYQSLPLFPHPEKFKARAIDGLRTNITAVFNAIALHNPYPTDYFEEAAWNQMVLKALFVDSRLSQIQGLDTRVNVKLARMLSDYAHERWAAGRAVNPQLWRSMGSLAEGDLLADFEKVLTQGELFEQQAAALALSRAVAPEAIALLDQVPELKQAMADDQLTWESFSVTHP